MNNLTEFSILNYIKKEKPLQEYLNQILEENNNEEIVQTIEYIKKIKKKRNFSKQSKFLIQKLYQIYFLNK